MKITSPFVEIDSTLVYVSIRYSTSDEMYHIVNKAVLKEQVVEAEILIKGLQENLWETLYTM